jgi:hypothetical protein
VVNAHLFILTDREIILIRDEDLVKGRPDLRYGGIWKSSLDNLERLKPGN